jgi:hypothetical protein
MAIQFSEDMISRMGETSAQQIRDALTKMQVEKDKKFRVVVIKDIPLWDYHKETPFYFDTQDEAENFLYYMRYEKLKVDEDIQLINPDGELLIAM